MTSKSSLNTDHIFSPIPCPEFFTVQSCSSLCVNTSDLTRPHPEIFFFFLELLDLISLTRFTILRKTYWAFWIGQSNLDLNIYLVLQNISKSFSVVKLLTIKNRPSYRIMKQHCDFFEVKCVQLCISTASNQDRGFPVIYFEDNSRNIFSRLRLIRCDASHLQVVSFMQHSSSV